MKKDTMPEPFKKDPPGRRPPRDTVINSPPDEYIAAVASAAAGGLLCTRDDEEHSIYYINHSLLELGGYTREELFTACDGRFSRLIHPDDRARVRREIERGLKDAGHYQTLYRVPTKNGQLRWLQESGRRLVFAAGERLLFRFSCDITARQEAEQETQVSAAFLREILDNLPGGFAVHALVEGQLCLELISQGFCCLIGKSRAELMAIYRADPGWGIHPDDIAAVMRTVEAGLAGGTGYECIYRMLDAQDQYFWVRSTSKIVTDEHGATKIYAVLTDISGLKAVEQELLYRDEMAQLLLEGDDSVIYDFDVATQNMELTYIAANGRRASRSIQDYFTYVLTSNILHPDYRQTICDHLQNGAKAPLAGALEYRGNYDGKGYKWYRALYKSLPDATGQVYRILGKAVNVQKEKDMERRFETELARRSTLESNLLDTACLDYTDDYVMDFDQNQPVISPLGVEVDTATLINTMANQVPDEKQRQEFIRHFDRANILEQYDAGKRQLFIEYQREAGRGLKWVRSETNLIEQPGSGHIIALIYSHDIDQQKMSELLMHSVMMSEFDMIIHINTGDGSANVYMKDSAANTISARYVADYYRDRAESLRRFALEEDLPHALEEAQIARIVKRLDSEGSYSYYYRLKAPDGSVARKKVHLLYSDRAAGIVSLVRTDVTEATAEEQRKNQLLNSALAAAEQANRAKSHFLTNISHDIRTPMNAIIGMSSIAAAHLHEPERVADCLHKITVSSHHLLSLINDVLDMSRIESGKMTLNEEAIHLPEFLRGLISIVQPQLKAAGLQLLIDTLDVIDEQVVSDKLRITQIFLNIVGNACKFTDPGGSVTIRIAQLPSRVKGHGAYQFTFSDTGIGMSAEFRERVFEPFERERSATITKKEGAGLGMAITKQIVDLMGGEISVASELNQGTTFTVTLDLPWYEGSDTIKEITELRGLRSLIADDDYSVCTSVSKMLREIGMRTDWTISGREAVFHTHAAQDEGDPYHLIILDWMIPDLTGVDTTRQIRRIVGAEVPIIILSAYDWAEIEADAYAAGVTAFIPKPLFRSDLYRVLRQVHRLEPQELPPEPPSRIDLTGKRILLVEDNELNMEIAFDVISASGMTPEMAWDGVEAVEKFTAAPEDHFDIILCDIQMPRMNGYEVAQIIRALPRQDVSSLPILALTADAFKEDITKALDAGMNGHIAKPIDPEELLNILSQHLKTNS